MWPTLANEALMVFLRNPVITISLFYVKRGFQNCKSFSNRPIIDRDMAFWSLENRLKSKTEKWRKTQLKFYEGLF